MIERDIGVIFFKKVQIIGWWNDTVSFVNVDICILEIITDIQNTARDSMHIHNINVDSEGVIMCHGTVGLRKINTLNLITPIFTVVCNKFPCIITVTFLNTWRNELTGNLVSIREIFYSCGIQNNTDIFVFFILHR